MSSERDRLYCCLASEDTTTICGATVRTWKLNAGIAGLWLVMAMTQYNTSIFGDGGIAVGATLDEQFVSEFKCAEIKLSGRPSRSLVACLDSGPFLLAGSRV